MTRLYNTLFRADSAGFLLLLLGVFVVGSFWLHPTLKQRFFSFERQRMLNGFLQQVEKKNTFDLREFWQFREFYSPGSFRINEEIVGVSETLIFTKLDFDSATFQWFESTFLKSSEMLMKTEKFDRNSFLAVPSGAEPIWHDSQTVIYRENGVVMIKFMRSTDELRQVNGMFDYTGNEKKFLTSMTWLHQSTILLK